MCEENIDNEMVSEDGYYFELFHSLFDEGSIGCSTTRLS